MKSGLTDSEETQSLSEVPQPRYAVEAHKPQQQDSENTRRAQLH